jgi:hypothetical protein
MFNGDNLYPSTEKLFNEAGIKRANEYLELLAENVKQKLIKRDNEYYKYNKKNLTLKVLNTVGNLSKEGQDWIKAQPIEIIYAINYANELKQSLRLIKINEVVKEVPTEENIVQENLNNKVNQKEDNKFYKEDRELGLEDNKSDLRKFLTKEEEIYKEI